MVEIVSVVVLAVGVVTTAAGHCVVVDVVVGVKMSGPRCIAYLHVDTVWMPFYNKPISSSSDCTGTHSPVVVF